MADGKNHRSAAVDGGANAGIAVRESGDEGCAAGSFGRYPGRYSAIVSGYFSVGACFDVSRMTNHP